jgi:hypothetical protein
MIYKTNYGILPHSLSFTSNENYLLVLSTDNTYAALMISLLDDPTGNHLWTYKIYVGHGTLSTSTSDSSTTTVSPPTTARRLAGGISLPVDSILADTKIIEALPDIELIAVAFGGDLPKFGIIQISKSSQKFIKSQVAPT